MKKISVSFLLIFLSVVVAKQTSGFKRVKRSSIQKYDTIFAKISRPRVGISNDELDVVANPFVGKKILKIIKDKNVTKPKLVKMKLYGLINNIANINKKWYRVGSNLYGYKLVKVYSDSVLLKRGSEKTKLFLRIKNDKIKISKGY